MKFTVKSVTFGALLSLVLVFSFVPQLFAKEGESGGSTTSPTTTTTNTTDKNSDSSESTSRTPARTEQPKLTEVRSETQNGTTDNDPETNPIENKEDNPKGELRKEVTREKLDDKKKALCEAHQSVVNKAMGNVVERSKNTYERITKIYTMSAQFYTEKGLSMSNYETLIANVEAAKTTAAIANTGLSSTPKLSCGSDGPRADVQAFRNKRLDKVETFGAYRDAVKTLVKAIHDAAKANETATPITSGGSN